MTLPQFEEKQVATATLKLIKAGDGLSEALALEPVALKHGDVVYYVLAGKVTQINHRPIDKDTPDILTRVHTVECTSITTIDPTIARPLIDTEAARLAELTAQIKAAELEAQGIVELPLDDENDEESSTDPS